MSAGIQVFDDNGNIILDLGDNLTQIIGEISTNSTSGSQAVSVPSGYSLFCFIASSSNSTNTSTDVSITENVISWSSSAADTIFYGIY